MHRHVLVCALVAGAALVTSSPASATPPVSAAPVRAAVDAASGTPGSSNARGRAAVTTTERHVAFRTAPGSSGLTPAGRPAGSAGSVVAGAGVVQVLDTGEVAVPARLAVIGATWTEGSGSGLTLSYRQKRQNAWGPWRTVDLEGCADCALPGTKTRAGSEPLAIIGATHVQARLVADGSPVHDPRLSIIDPGTALTTSPGAAAPVPGVSAPRAALPVAGKGLSGPTTALVRRADWGATETDATRRIAVVVPRGIVVHHTAGTNDYGPDQVPAILRGIQRFHVQDRGWSDIGYNVLVDRYGREWEGRPGGIDAPHRGAHASGVNGTYLGVSYIGDSSQQPATAAGVNALVDVVGKASARFGFDTLGTLQVSGRTAPVVPGHYQVGHTRTSCPGVDLTRRLPEIRQRAAQRAQEFRAARS